ncbi:hypothetical protein G3480_21445 [Thiorhodococcus mannitoliphagus]|uniref:Uncharacterized protein n=1 Tax=Thiorhodococcus mannitoliphagus TaxID=329406 RepID=A0A6P1E0R8_9GAMM|nr:hypothetical protein [Thiorhodococcus mannitoliphagus]NEX22833.1 hypothetical protein [Thiorhodococcus mannitoliphagus]
MNERVFGIEVAEATLSSRGPTLVRSEVELAWRVSGACRSLRQLKFGAVITDFNRVSTIAEWERGQAAEQAADRWLICTIS